MNFEKPEGYLVKNRLTNIVDFFFVIACVVKCKVVTVRVRPVPRSGRFKQP